LHWIKSWYARAWAVVMASLSGAGAHGQADPDISAWRDAERRGTADAYQQYLDDFPVGQYADQAFRRLVEERLEDAEGAATRGLGGSIDLY
jgi:hypothetical protein